MEHPVIVIMPLKVIPYLTGSGIFLRPKVIYTEKFDTQIMRSDLQQYSSFICKHIPNAIYKLVFRAICNAYANFWNENAMVIALVTSYILCASYELLLIARVASCKLFFCLILWQT